MFAFGCGVFQHQEPEALGRAFLLQGKGRFFCYLFLPSSKRRTGWPWAPLAASRTTSWHSACCSNGASSVALRGVWSRGYPLVNEHSNIPHVQ